MGQRGTSLIEVLIVTAILVMATGLFFALSGGTRAFSARSSASGLEATLAYAKAVAASSGDGATLAFAQRRSAGGAVLAGFVVTVYSGRPNGSMARVSLAPFAASATITEAKLGEVPFAIFLDGAGHASAAEGTVSTGSRLPGDPGCPSGESSLTLRLADQRFAYPLTLPCNSVVSGEAEPVQAAGP